MMKFYFFIWVMCGLLPSVAVFLMTMTKLSLREFVLFGLHSAMGPIYPVLAMLVMANRQPPSDDKDTKK